MNDNGFYFALGILTFIQALILCFIMGLSTGGSYIRYEIAAECQKLGGFYVEDTTYLCSIKKEQ